jgi:hypothetical protein
MLAEDSFRYLLVGSQTLSTRFATSLAESSDVAINTTVLTLNLRAIRSNMAWLTTSAADSGGTVLGIVVSRSIPEVSRWMVESDSGRYLLLAVATSGIGNIFALVNERLELTSGLVCTIASVNYERNQKTKDSLVNVVTCLHTFDISPVLDRRAGQLLLKVYPDSLPLSLAKRRRRSCAEMSQAWTQRTRMELLCRCNNPRGDREAQLLASSRRCCTGS